MRIDDQRRMMITDVLLGVGMFGLSLGALYIWKLGDETNVRPLDLWVVPLVGLQTLSLIWRRKFPVTVLSLTIIGFVIDRGLNYPSSWAFFGIAFAMYTVGAQLEPRRSLLIGGITLDIVLLWTVVGIIVNDVDPLALLSELAVLGFPLMLGRESYHRQRRMVELERRAIRAEHEREQRAAEAVRNERVRIARELHDVVAHEITVMTLQTTGARRVLETDSDRATQAMVAAEAAGHRALTEMRRLLGMLRTSDPRATAPQPGLDSLESLVEQMNLAGLETELTVRGEARAVPIGVDLNAYRIIQESLTNTLKHGGPNVSAAIEVAYDKSSLSVQVTDDGRGASTTQHPQNGEGQGLVGMHERVALLEGSLSAGPKPGGGYRVTAEIPIPA
ncbi:MAG: sensor histidine kinase [bacterium]|nr:sensor histidine kinase [bacterium]